MINIDDKIKIEVIPHWEEMHPKELFEFQPDIDYVLEQIETGNIWSWCIIEVKASYLDFEYSSYLGGNSYKDEAEFRSDGYYSDLVHEAKEGLKNELSAKYEVLKPIFEVKREV